MIKKILVAIDKTESSKKAFNFALNLAEKLSAKLVLLNVINYGSRPIFISPFIFPMYMPGEVYYQYKKRIKNNSKNFLSESLKEIKKKNPNLEVSTELEEGYPSKTILEIAQKENVDIIVMGRRNLNRIKRFFVGSVSKDVVKEANCPILIVK